MDTIQISDIRIGTRRREDMGDIETLAESIGKYGLLAPPVLTDDGTLVAGQRRVEAMKLLGWTETPFINKGQLTQAQLHEIELEENIRRKDFTEYEISKNMVALAEAVGARLLEQTELQGNPCTSRSTKGITAKDDFSSTVDEKSDRGRPTKPNSDDAVAEEIGVKRPTLHNARAHVAAIEAYPALEPLPKMKAISIAKQAAKLPEDQRDQYVREQVNPRCDTKPSNAEASSGNILSFPSPHSTEHVEQSDIESEATADTRAYNLTKAYNNTICAVMQLETSPDAVREWMRFSRMNREEINGTVTDIEVAIEHLNKIKSALCGSLAPQLCK